MPCRSNGPQQDPLAHKGFSDVTLHGSNRKGDTTSFTLGQLDLFVTSDLSDRLKFLSEIVFERADNAFAWMSNACCSPIHSAIS